MKIVILDAYTTNPGDLSWDWLSQYGEYTVYDRTPREKTVERCRDAQIVITNKTVLDRAILEQLPELKWIELLSTGFNVIDCAYTREHGIPVCNIPAYSTGAVAQLTFALLLELCCQVGLHSQSVHEGEWTRCADFCYWKTPLAELAGKTLGIIGFGKIGQAVATIAIAMGMEVLVHTPHPKREFENEFLAFVPLEELLEKSDVVSLHCPLTPQTTRMVNADFLRKMKPGARLINTSRGPALDEQAVAHALNSGRLAGAGVDVLSTEPPRADNPLLTAKNCVITPHIAWAALETRSRLMKICQDNFKAYFSGKPIHVVNGL